MNPDRWSEIETLDDGLPEGVDTRSTNVQGELNTRGNAFGCFLGDRLLDDWEGRDNHHPLVPTGRPRRAGAAVAHSTRLPLSMFLIDWLLEQDSKQRALG